jgi:hypothetical protein
MGIRKKVQQVLRQAEENEKHFVGPPGLTIGNSLKMPIAPLLSAGQQKCPLWDSTETGLLYTIIPTLTGLSCLLGRQ